MCLIRQGRFYHMAASRRYTHGLLFFIVFIILVFPQLDATASDESGIAPSDPEGSARRTIVLSTPFPKIAPSHAIYQSLHTEIFRRMGYDVQLNYYPDVRELIEVNAGHLDGSSGRIYDIDPENNYPNLIRIEEVILPHRGIAITKDASIRIPDWASLKGYKISYISGDKWIENVLPRYVGADDVYPAGDWLQALRLLDTGRVDVYLELDDMLGIIKIVDEFKNKPFFNAGTIALVEMYPYLNKKNQALVQPMISTLKAMKTDGTYERLVSKPSLKD